MRKIHKKKKKKRQTSKKNQCLEWTLQLEQQNRSYDHVNIKLLKQLQPEGYSSRVLHNMKTKIAKNWQQ
jgi:hypothetical protein